jgi:hypothetical protein
MHLKPLAVVVFLSLAARPLSAAPLEDDAIYPSDWGRSRAQAIADDASMLIRRARYRCDSVSSLRPWFSGDGFTIFCNDFRYEYEIEDRGGRWVVTVQ